MNKEILVMAAGIMLSVIIAVSGTMLLFKKPHQANEYVEAAVSNEDNNAWTSELITINGRRPIVRLYKLTDPDGNQYIIMESTENIETLGTILKKENK